MCDDPYYKLYLNRDDKLTVVCLQQFDECDYTHRKFYGENGEHLSFDTEDDAVEFLNANFPLEVIDPEFLTPMHPDFS